jgi:hypothetical protein
MEVTFRPGLPAKRDYYYNLMQLCKLNDVNGCLSRFNFRARP